MKGIIVAASILCIALIGLGVFFTLHTTSNQVRVIPVNQQFTDRVANAGWVEGAAKPEVKVVEFGDFQCPGCAALYPILNETINQTNSFVQFTFKEYPLSQHNKARLAAEGAEAAGKQGKFWQMHDVLYATQTTWENYSISDFKQYMIEHAQSFGINADQYKNDLNDTHIADEMNKDVTDGNNLPVSATPTIVINGKKLDNIPATPDAFVQLLQSYRTAPVSSPTP